jgi:hypothetical protein
LQSLLMETAWVCGWFQRVMSHIVEIKKAAESGADAAEHHVIIADRSPLSAVFYSRSDGHLLEPLIRQYVAELKAVADVHIHTVHLRTERALLWARILDRLEREPSRLALGEDKQDWMDRVLAFYDRMAWDVTVHNNLCTMPVLVADVLGSLSAHSEAVAVAVKPALTRALTEARAQVAAAALATPIKSSAHAASDDDMDATANLAGAIEGAADGQGISPTAPLRPEAVEALQRQAAAAAGGVNLSAGLGLGY